MTYLNFSFQRETSEAYNKKYHKNPHTEKFPQIYNSISKSGKYENKHQSVF